MSTQRSPRIVTSNI